MEATLHGGSPPLSSEDFPPLPTQNSPVPNSSQKFSVPTNKSHLPEFVSTSNIEKPISSSLWTNLFQRVPTKSKSFPPPIFNKNGVPVVKAPSSILIKSSEAWKEFIICHFFGDPPSLRKIFSDLNLDTGFWSAGTVAFIVSLWTPSTKLTEQTLTSAPVWLQLQRVPPQLWSHEGFALIASGVGDSLPLAKSDAASNKFPSPRVRAVIPLDKGPLPPTVIVEDEEGCQVEIGIQYVSIPPLCPTFHNYGHRSHRCPHRTQAPSSTKVKPTSTRPSQHLPASSDPSAAKSSQLSGLDPLSDQTTVPQSVQRRRQSIVDDEDAALGFVGAGPHMGLNDPLSRPIAVSSTRSTEDFSSRPTDGSSSPPSPNLILSSIHPTPNLSPHSQPQTGTARLRQPRFSQHRRPRSTPTLHQRRFLPFNIFPSNILCRQTSYPTIPAR